MEIQIIIAMDPQYKVTLGLSYDWNLKNRGLMSQQVWHDKDQY